MDINHKAQAFYNFIMGMNSFVIADEVETDNEALNDVPVEELEQQLYEFVSATRIPVANAVEAEQIVSATADLMNLSPERLKLSVLEHLNMGKTVGRQTR